MSKTAVEELVDDFSVLDDWEERYRYVIELGRLLPDMPVALKTSATKVSGCASQVWIHSTPVSAAEGMRLRLIGDSDALLVKGLIAIVFKIFSPMTVAEVVTTDTREIFARLGLQEHLTPQRSNGLVSMVLRIKSDARRVLVG